MAKKSFQRDPSHPESTSPPHGEPPAESLDGAVVKSLMLMTHGDPAPFREHRLPPPEILTWIDGADIEQVRGLLLSALRRWHELRRPESGSTPE